MEVRIASNDPENEAGEIITRGLNVMKGYYKNEKDTQKVLDGDLDQFIEASLKQGV